MTWYNGAWWPIYQFKWYPPYSSRYPLDPYSLAHMQTGIISFFLFGYPLWILLWKKTRHNNVNDSETLYSKLSGKMTLNHKSVPLWFGFIIAFVVSLIFEIVENDRYMVDKFRDYNDNYDGYGGDSYQNIIGDLIMVQGLKMIFQFIIKRPV